MHLLAKAIDRRAPRLAALPGSETVLHAIRHRMSLPFEASRIIQIEDPRTGTEDSIIVKGLELAWLLSQVPRAHPHDPYCQSKVYLRSHEVPRRTSQVNRTANFPRVAINVLLVIWQVPRSTTTLLASTSPMPPTPTFGSSMYMFQVL